MISTVQKLYNCDDAYIEAAKARNHQVIELILEKRKGTIRVDHCVNAIKQAVIGDHKNVVHSILNKRKDISIDNCIWPLIKSK